MVKRSPPLPTKQEKAAEASGSVAKVRPPRPGQPRQTGASSVASAATQSSGVAGEPLIVAPRLRKGDLVANKCRLERLIARGGMGAVWLGWDTALDRPVAIKFMDAAVAASKGLRTRFNREAKAAAKLRTPHVVQIFEHGLHRGLPYIVMELLEGEDLHDRLKRERRLSLWATAKIARETAKALRRAHSKGIIHRDLKPRNIFIAVDEEDEVVKILDFGIAKSLGQPDDGETTKTGQVLGSPAFMSPEQARGFKTIDHRTDLWSLGVILFRAVTGTIPFRGEASGDIIVKICTETVPVPSSIAPGLPPAVDAFFARALARDPNDRFQSATELAQAFTEVARAGTGAPLGPSAGGPQLSEPGEWTPLSDPGSIGSSVGSDPSFDFGSCASGMGPSSPSVDSLPGVSTGSDASGSGIVSAPGQLSEASAASNLPSDAGTPGPQSDLPVSLTDPSVFNLQDQGPARRSKGLWVGAGAAVLAFIVGGFVLAGGDDAPTKESDARGHGTGAPTAPTGDAHAGSAAATAGAQSAASAPDLTHSAGPVPVATASAAPSASATKAASATTAEPPPPTSTRPKPRPRPPRPTATATKSKWNWGY